MSFSARLPAGLQTNELTRLLRAKQAQGLEILDLTESNPTHAGIVYPAGFLSCMDDARALNYEPEPFGLPAARATIAEEYGVPFDRVTLSASTSEAYSWIFKLLCDPGDRVLVPRPSYPLFAYLAGLECVEAEHYSLFYDYGWYIDFHTLERAITNRTKAVVIVNPNNPTGHFLRRHEMVELVSLCAARNVAIISDEVFKDYKLDMASDAVPTLREGKDTLTFCLNGLSKTVGLPQMKLAWMFVNGPATLLSEALSKLEIIADTYLSAATPVQLALPELLKLREPVQLQIVERLRRNLANLVETGIRVLRVEAGWYAVIQLPGRETDEQWAMRLLRDHDVLIQPGYFYDFERSHLAVLSLLTRPEIFSRALRSISPLQ